MQFIPYGPDIPDTLLQAHEEGRVVFFCGAGISFPAGLPSFDGLVNEIYRRVGTEPSDIEEVALKRGQYDTTLDLLERRLPGQRLAMRCKLAEVLKPKLRRSGATETHTALLRLARNRQGVLRLVTTNFDRVFHVAAKQSGQAFKSYSAPMLPIPKNSRWNGVVYLHGMLHSKADDEALNRLVVTSGDFGLAYLIERWAARFVSELFRNYVVCFVGYSINDPVLRYMMDALAADHMLGEVTPQAWAFGDCEPGQENRKTVEWESKGVTPILYHVNVGTHDHSALHQTLKAWAEIYRDGITGKERIVVAHALARPANSTQQDDFVGRMLWALSDPSGLPARRFAEFNPVPPLDWLLDAFAVDRYGHTDLARFGVSPCGNANSNLQFSLIHRPAAYPLAPRMQLLAGDVANTRWDNVMSQLACWLVRHLNDPRLVLWIAERGGCLHEQWIWLIERKLDELVGLERDGKTSDLDDIRVHARNAIPGPLMRTLWRLLLGRQVKSPWHEHDLYRWKNRLKREGLTAPLRLELRKLLAPKVRLSKPFHRYEELENTDEPTHLRQLVNWELVLTANHVRTTLRDMDGDQWQAALPTLLEDIQLLLRDALDLRRELDKIDEYSDRSYLYLPSIQHHQQNTGFRDWATLIELLRNAWLAVLNIDRDRAVRIAATWFELPYPTFKRLALFAASQDGCIAPEQWVEWLLADSTWWLWAIDTRREVLRLLVLQGCRLTSTSQERLESAILAGPPRKMYPANIEPDRWKEFVEHLIWLRLAKLKSSGLTLGLGGVTRLAELSGLHPQWQLAPDERDEFSIWSSRTGDPDFEIHRQIDIAPRKRHELLQWLIKPQPERHTLYEDTWPDVCRTRFFHSFYALCDLAHENVWPLKYWREALQVWSDDGLVLRSWRYAAPLVQTMPDSEVQKLVNEVTRWLEAASKSINRHEDILLQMCQRILDLPLDEDTGIRGSDGKAIQRPVTEAINHPIGHVTDALINLCFKHELNDDDGLPEDIKPLFTRLCDVQVKRFRHGRVLLASQLIPLFRVDRQWTEQHLLPLLDWSTDPMEATGAWVGFLLSPRLYQPLLLAFKPHFLATAHHYYRLGEHRQQFAAFLTYAALEHIDGYTAHEWRNAITALPQEGLQESAQALVQALEGAADQREEYWKNRIQPFWQHHWPKSKKLASTRISESLTQLCLEAGSEFPAALSTVCDWLLPIENTYYIFERLNELKLCCRFPNQVLQLLEKTITDQHWLPPELGQCLDIIAQADANLAQNPNYQRLRDYTRK